MNRFLFYKIEKENYLIGYDGQSDVLVLPESYDGENYRVNTRAFSGCRWLKSVTIPKCVIGIDNLAFSDCDGLGYYAFYNNHNLKRVDYNGTRAQWNNIKTKPYNTCLFNATINNYIG